jgi:hypothetical protein
MKGGSLFPKSCIATRTFILLTILAVGFTSADSTYEFRLMGVRMTRNAGGVLNGYVIWRPTAYRAQHWPDTMPSPAAAVGKGHLNSWIDLYTDSMLRTVEYPRKGLVVMIASPLAVCADSVDSVSSWPGTYHGYGSVDRIPRVLPGTAELLKTPPLAQCEGSAFHATTVYWLSYTQDITKQHLDELCRFPFVEYFTGNEGAERRGLVYIALTDD